MITLDVAKKHCRIDHSFDDDLLNQFIAAAEEHLRSIGVSPIGTPSIAAIEQAQLLLIAHFYENRDVSGDLKSSQIEFSIDRLVAPYRSIEV
jgi:uncharacterized phage protein (predicted DNA packaging)